MESNELKPLTKEEWAKYDHIFGDNPFSFLAGPNLIRFLTEEIATFSKYNWKAYRETEWKALGFEIKYDEPINLYYNDKIVAKFSFRKILIEQGLEWQKEKNLKLNTYEQIQIELTKENIDNAGHGYNEVQYLSQAIQQAYNYSPNFYDNKNAADLIESAKFNLKFLKLWNNKSNFEEISNLNKDLNIYFNVFNDSSLYYQHVTKIRKRKYLDKINKLKTEKSKLSKIKNWNELIKEEITKFDIKNTIYSELLFSESDS